jgi:hypothetical protein
LILAPPQAVSGLDHHLQVEGGAGPGHVLQGETVDISLVGDEVEIGADSLLGRVDETEVPNHVHDPESLSPVAASMIFPVGGTTIRVVYLSLA